VLLGASAHGKPQRPDRGRPAQHRRRLRRTGHRHRHARPATATARRRTVAGDKGYDTRGFIAQTRALGFTPHVAQNNTMRLRRCHSRGFEELQCAPPCELRGDPRASRGRRPLPLAS
jgi:hypothetical protein